MRGQALVLATLACALRTHASRPLPQWKYNSTGFPSGWFGSNASGLENDAQLEAIGRYGFATFGWQQCLSLTNYTNEAACLVEQARVVKKRRPDMPVAIYLDGVLAEPFQKAVRAAMFGPEASLYRDYFLRDQAGNPITCDTFCRQMPGMAHTDPRCLAWYFNWFNESAVQWYINQYVAPIAKQPGFDAVFFDGCDEWIKQPKWKDAANVGANRTDADAIRVMMDVRVQTSQALTAAGKYPLYSEHLGDTSAAEQAYISGRMEGVGYFRYFEFFNPTAVFIESLLNETQRKGKGKGKGKGSAAVTGSGGASAHQALPLMCRQLISNGLKLSDSIAAFLIVKGNFSYYSASTGWFNKDWVWHDEYDVDYGTPVGDAVTEGNGVYTREFTRCGVRVNCTGVGRGNCVGNITMH